MGTSYQISICKLIIGGLHIAINLIQLRLTIWIQRGGHSVDGSLVSRRGRLMQTWYLCVVIHD